MRNRNALVIVVGVVLALLGAGIAVAYVKGNGDSSGSTRAVVVATRAVPAGTPVASAGLAVRKVDTKAVPPDALANADVLNGQIALVALSPNTVVTRTMFGVQGVATAGGVVLPQGKKGIGVELGFAPGGLRYVVPGNRIDILASRKDGGTTVLLTDVEVIATTPGAGNGAATAATSGSGTLDFLLAVDQQQALKIVGAQSQGQSLYFVLASTRKGAA
jgi:pilus assembly protein CpaB